MKHALSTLLLLAGTVSGAAFGQEPTPQAEGRSFTEATWASCAKCHAAPDARVPHDARWIGLNSTTACLTGNAATPQNRKRLIEYLKGGSAPVSKLVRPSKAGAAPVPGHGTVRVPATSGSAFLRRTDTDDAATLRLFWDKSPEGSNLALPSGEYQLIGYCFYRKDTEGPWTASATVQEGQAPDTIKVTSHKPAPLPIQTAIYHDLSAIADGPLLSISFQMRNEAGDRMTLTQNGKLVEPTWFATDAGDKEVASGGFVPT